MTMLRSMLKSKIHRARITEANLAYEGSISVDRSLMEAADILPFEQVMVYNISNGERFDTYALQGKSGTICLNGAAARKGSPGDLIIIASYGMYSDDEIGKGKSVLVFVNENNQLQERNEIPWEQS